jgi:glycosyltransferase involved in cell wall biosynthesis
MKTKPLSNSTNETLLVITSMPAAEKKDGMRVNFNAMGWHSEKTLKNLAKTHDILVAAEKTPGEPDVSVQNDMRVIRIWSKTNIVSLFSLFSLIKLYPNIRSVYIPFEFNVFGGIIPNVILLIVLGILRIMGKHITVEIHQVILDISRLEKHIAITNRMLQIFFNISLRLYYMSLGMVSNAIIVFEEELKHRLAPYIDPNRIHTLSLAIETKQTISKEKARIQLGVPQDTFVLMVFGFINGYKGIDWIIDAFSHYKGKDITLLIAGGKNPYLAKDPHYKQFYASIIKAMGRDTRIIHTGFVPDTDVPACFSACDLVVLPYEVFMSASGPFSLALSYKKPVLLSSALSLYAQSPDIKQALKNAHLPKNQLFFPLEQTAFLHRVHTYVTNTHAQKSLVRFSSLLGSYRSMDEVIKKYDAILFPRQIQSSFVPTMRQTALTTAVS